MSKILVNNFSHQVYNLCSQIPHGQVSTYKHIARVLATSPRAIGRVLKNNPYLSSVVPCHRVIATNCFIGGFRGEWGQGEKITEKKSKLAQEGILFDPQGYLLKDLREKVMFQDFHE